MKIELIINPAHAHAAEIQADLSGELAAIPPQARLKITTLSAPPPPKTLGFEVVSQFIIEHLDEIKNFAVLLKAIIDIAKEVSRRRGDEPLQRASKAKQKSKHRKQKEPKSQPAVVINIDGDILEIPTTAAKESSFIARVLEKKPS